MSNVLKIAGEVVIGAALIVATAGTAAALIGGYSLAAAVSIGAGIVGSIGIGLGSVLAIGTGLQLAGGLLAKKPQVSPSQVDRTKVSLVLDAPRTIVFGHTALATDLRYQESYGAEQEYLSQVLVVASHWCESIDQVWLNDVIGWDATSGTASGFSGYFFVVRFPQATSSSSFNVNAGSGHWATNATFTGCATLHLQYRVIGTNNKAGGPFSTSIPSRVTVRGHGARVYDPRLDSTAGGSGSQRVTDQTTWAFAPSGVENGRNPALCLLFYLLGWRIQNPVTGAWKLAVGLGIPVERIDLSSFITAANFCDETVTLAAGGTEPRYRCDGMFSEADDPGTVITALEASMNAKVRDSSGQFSLQVFHNDLSTPVLDFTDDDVLDDFTWDAGGALNELKNVVKGRYVDPSDASLYQLVDYPSVSVTSLDGIDRIDTFDLGLVQSPSQAQRLAKARLQRYQYPGTFAANFKARAWAVKDGDVVRLTFAALGFTTKLFRVTKSAVDVTGVVPLTLAEENAAIYAWDAEDSPAVVAAAPNTFDPTQEPIRLAIDDAAETAAWSQVTNDNALRPQDGATRNVNRGSWSSGTIYAQGDIVLYSGSSYSANGAVPAGTLPTNTAYWTLLIAGGVPGPAGANGVSPYVHVAYANSSDGSSGFVTGVANPGRTYIGIYIDTTSAGSGDYHAYNWSRLTGADGTDGSNGVPGAPGANGLTPYVHFAYADSADGSSGFSFSPGTHKYVGIYTDFTSGSSSSYTAYAWSLIKGTDGATGGPGLPGTNGANGIDGLAALKINTVGAVTWDGHNLLCSTRHNDWNTNGAYSSNVIPGGVSLSFQRPNTYDSTSEDAFVGIASAPTASLDYPAVEFAWRMYKDTSGSSPAYTAQVWHAGTFLYSEGWNGSSTYSIRYDSNTGYVTFYRYDGSTTTAVYSYNAGTGKSYGFQATAAGGMSCVNVAFTAAGGTGATGATGPAGAAGTSPAPAYPAMVVSGEGTTTYPNPIPLANGQTIGLTTGFYGQNTSGYDEPAPTRIVMQQQYSLDGSSWTVMGSGNPQIPANGAASVSYTAGYTNSSGGPQVVRLRTVVSHTGSDAIYYSNGYGQPA